MDLNLVLQGLLITLVAAGVVGLFKLNNVVIEGFGKIGERIGKVEVRWELHEKVDNERFGIVMREIDHAQRRPTTN